MRDAFLVTDAEDQRAFEDVPFATMTLLSSRFFPSIDLQNNGDGAERKLMPGRVFRIALSSKYGRDALSIDLTPPSTPAPLRLINIHLDSLGDALPHRAAQLEILADVLREPGCTAGLIAGDFNALGPRDHALVGDNGLEDAWVALYGAGADRDGATWGVGMELRDGLAPGRLDKVAMLGVEAEEMEVLRPGFIEVPGPAAESKVIPWSDHCGLRCKFTIPASSLV